MLISEMCFFFPRVHQLCRPPVLSSSLPLPPVFSLELWRISFGLEAQLQALSSPIPHPHSIRHSRQLWTENYYPTHCFSVWQESAGCLRVLKTLKRHTQNKFVPGEGFRVDPRAVHNVWRKMTGSQLSGDVSQIGHQGQNYWVSIFLLGGSIFLYDVLGHFLCWFIWLNG